MLYLIPVHQVGRSGWGLYSACFVQVSVGGVCMMADEIDTQVHEKKSTMIFLSNSN